MRQKLIDACFCAIYYVRALALLTGILYLITKLATLAK